MIMPISDQPGYEKSHFTRVYEHLIKPAVIKAGFEPFRADEVKQTNVIVIDILKRIITSDMAICDLSARNPNVLYELGIRQSFDLPVTLLKDEKTIRIFDIQGFRDLEYNSNLRIDEVNKSIEKLADSIATTYDTKDGDVNSIIDLLKINKAQIKGEINLSPETNLILDQLQDLRMEVNDLKEKQIKETDWLFSKEYSIEGTPTARTQDNELHIGQKISHLKFGEGIILRIEKSHTGGDTIKVDFKKSGIKNLLYPFVKRKLDDLSNQANEQ